MNSVVVVAPHPDDETLGCGGMLLRHRAAGDRLHWLIATTIEGTSFPEERIRSRRAEIDAVAARYGFETVHNLGYPTTTLDAVHMGDIVTAVKEYFQRIQPTHVYLPYRGDAHSDHAVVFDAVVSSVKWFRLPSVRAVYVYETLSETDFGMNPDTNGFRPNLFADISAWLDEKMEIMALYAGELGQHPFPRSERSIRALAALRGAAAGCEAAEAFMILKQIV